MSDQVIICPNCSAEIPLTQTLIAQIRSSLEKDIELKLKQKEKAIEQKQKVLSQKEEELKIKAGNLEEEIKTKLKTEVERLRGEEREKLSRENRLEFDDLKNQLKEKDDKLAEALKHELELRKRERQLEDSKKAFELEVQRKLDKERENIKKEAIEQIGIEYQLKIGDFENRIKGLNETINELKQKAEQGSQQAQGEVLEIQLEEILKSAFPCDNIKPVPKGASGADLIQEVFDDSGKICGTIIWESKRTKTWNNKWIEKLKDDQRKAKAEIAVILSTAMPNGDDGFVYLDGVWVTNYRSVNSLATILRYYIINLHVSRSATVGRGQKMEMLYRYLSGPEFKLRIETIVETFSYLRNQLDKEKVAMTKQWAEREKQIQKVMENTVGMYGDMQGIIGASLPQIKRLELNAPD